MAEPSLYPDYIARCERGPVTRAGLREDLTRLGVKSGMLLMCHASLSGLGFVTGGAVNVVALLLELLGPEGTLVMPSFSTDNSDPKDWKKPPVPVEWWETIRAEMPAYDPAATPLAGDMGAIASCFCFMPGTLRSGHPALSWAARGPLARAVLEEHALTTGLGEESPLGRCYALDAQVLSLGCLRTTILHLAEHRCEWPGKRMNACGAAMLVEGRREWVPYEDIADENDDFETIRQEFIRSEGEAQRGVSWDEGVAGYGPARLLSVRPLVDFAAAWIAEHRGRERMNTASGSNPTEPAP